MTEDATDRMLRWMRRMDSYGTADELDMLERIIDMATAISVRKGGRKSPVEILRSVAESDAMPNDDVIRVVRQRYEQRGLIEDAP